MRFAWALFVMLGSTACSSHSSKERVGWADGNAGAGAAAGYGGGAQGGSGQGDVSACTPSDSASGLLFAAQTEPSVIAVDDTHLYWVNKTAAGFDIQKAPKAGGCPEPLKANAFTSQSTIKDILVDSKSVYVASSERTRAIVRWDKATGAELATAECSLGGSGVAGQNAVYVFFACTDAGSTLRWFEKATNKSIREWNVPDRVPLSGIAASEAHAYFAIQNGSVERVTLDGAPAGTVVQDDTFRRVAYGVLLWALSDNAVWSVKEGEGGVEQTNVLVNPLDIAAHGSTAFVLERGERQGAATVIQLAPAATYELDVTEAGGFAVDAEYIYVTDRVSGTVSRIQRR